ncbi:YHYH protein [bacterium]|nr:MAG: YHYH protein [bacterium]
MKSKKAVLLIVAIGALSTISAGGYVYAQQDPFFGGPPGGGPPPGFDEDEGDTGPLPDPKVTIEDKNGIRTITSNGIPNHVTGQFPGPGNPNRISAQNYKFRMPDKPVMGAITSFGHDDFGVAVNGIPFDPGTNEFWNGNRTWNYEALSGNVDLGTDSSNAHVQPGGAYHYHGLPVKLIEKVAKKDQMVLIGYGSDGFPIYATYGYAAANNDKSGLKKLRSSYRLKEGTRPAGNTGPGGAYDGTFTADWEYVKGAGDLDECNGRTGITPEYPQGTYYYVLTDEFPFIPRYHHAKADSSFAKGPPGGRGGPGMGGGPGFGGPGMGGPGFGGPDGMDGPPPGGPGFDGPPPPGGPGFGPPPPF